MPHVAAPRGDFGRLAEGSESGATDIARRAAEALAALPRADVLEAVRTLIRGHPAMAPLWRLGAAVLSSEDHVAAASELASRVTQERAGVAAAAARILPERVVTHSYSDTMVAAVVAAGASALCAVSEPGGEGAVTAERLKAAGRAARVLGDAEALDAAAAGTAVVTGADALAPGGVVNKVGTAALAEAARSSGGRCFAVAGTSKFAAEDLPAPHPFERAPLDGFASVITDAGVLSPRDALRLSATFPIHPALRDLLG
jgi:translation initiation factor 2B subunit (eIF-2B alpha/beta/delta family)